MGKHLLGLAFQQCSANNPPGDILYNYARYIEYMYYT